MDDLAAWRKSVENEIKECNDYIESVRKHVNFAVKVQERKQEAEAKLAFLNAMPEDYLYETAPSILPFQLSEEGKLTQNLPKLVDVPQEGRQNFITSSGSVSIYQQALYDATTRFSIEQLPVPAGIANVHYMYTTLAMEKSKKAELPEMLDKINQDLGKMFTVAKDSVEKANSKIISVSQAATAMRDVISQLWGGLASLSRTQKPDVLRNVQHVQLRKASHRALVAQCLVDDALAKVKLEKVLCTLSELYEGLSDNQFGKNPLNVDLPQLNDMYHRWILHLDDIVKLTS